MNKKPFMQMFRELEEELKFQNPNDDYALIHARMLGLVLAHIPDETMETILEYRKEECIRCGEMVLPSKHGDIGCDV